MRDWRKLIEKLGNLSVVALGLCFVWATVAEAQQFGRQKSSGSSIQVPSTTSQQPQVPQGSSINRNNSYEYRGNSGFSGHGNPTQRPTPFPRQHRDHHHGHGSGYIYGQSYFPQYGYQSGVNITGGFGIGGGSFTFGRFTTSPFIGYYGPSSIYVAPSYGYGTAVGPPGYASYGPNYSYIPMAPQVIQTQPQFLGTNPFNNEVLGEALQENDERWNQPINPGDPQKLLDGKPAAPTAEALKDSLRAIAEGDVWFREQLFSKAYERYKQAVLAAPGYGEARYRLGFVLMQLGRYDRAVEEFRLGTLIDPSQVVVGTSLSKLFGEDNQLAKTAFKHRVADWVREDIRDPDRLFLFGIVLHFDNDPRAREPFEAAWRLSGGRKELTAFLNPVKIKKEGEVQIDPPQPLDEVNPDPGLNLPPLPAPANKLEGPNI
ncbi:tetratricopeptide repeat protein [Calycomorphotria hydatis]|uniref:Tetratricopeptide repeat protein n=1 Tax=Calycomorphotria hydatis TaxID=2528027 RepID=A0A517T9C3_9PLAN|nr:tetratricopeptide repeat protein [Calycomorphotria hydatis]QDT64966.1 Tetratricopeptide repeat protein [Calycomorphotria hydatis]